MVFLVESSAISQQQFPFIFEWDSFVRKHYNYYQKLINAQSYQLQRIQRYLFALPYPIFYNRDVVNLNLLERKQQVGEVTKQQIEKYKTINPEIQSDFSRTFNHSWNFPKLGFAIGAPLFTFGYICNFSITLRFMLFAVPVVLDIFRNGKTIKTQENCVEFLDWVIAYRRARAFNEIHRDLFRNQQTRQVIGQQNMVELGKSLVKLASEN